MTVKQFLGSYNIGRSAIKEATVVNTSEGGEAYTYSERELISDAYGTRFGGLKINTFTITEEKLVIYAR